MIQLSEKQWTTVIMQALAVLLRILAKNDEKIPPTLRDRANEAIQNAYMRFVRMQPTDVQTIEALIAYLVKAARSEMYNERKVDATRKDVEAEAVAEAEHLGDTKTASTEAMNLEVARESRKRRRDRRLVKALREELERANDTIALGTMSCIARGIDEPREQARILKCDIEEIYKARKRRERAAERVLAAFQDDDEDEEEVA